MKTVWVINGPNLNLLGDREPGIYGSQTLEQITLQLETQAQQLGLNLESFQSNHEGAIIDKIQEIRHLSAGLILNPGGLTHTSVSLRDTLSAYPHPIIEVHLSNIHQREAFRHHSYVSPVAMGVICGLGPDGYRFALESLAKRLGEKASPRFYGM